MQGQCLSFQLVLTLSVYKEDKLRYGEFTMYTVVIQYVSGCCHGNGKISYSPNEFFLEDFFFAFRSAPVNNLAPMRNVLGGAK